jgi:hypothetical protein
MEGEFFARRGRVLVLLFGAGFCLVLSQSLCFSRCSCSCLLTRTPLYARIVPLAGRETVRLDYAGMGLRLCCHPGKRGPDEVMD